MSDSPKGTSLVPAVSWMLAGLLALASALFFPASLRSVSPGVLRQAARGTPGLAEFADRLLAGRKPGAAALVASAEEGGAAPAFQEALAGFAARQPAVVEWGAEDPFIAPLAKEAGAAKGEAVSTPALEFLIRGGVRENAAAFLAHSRSPGTLALLGARAAADTGRFVPAGEPGGQTLDAVLLLGALLYQGEHFGDGLRREIRALAGQAAATGKLGGLEGVCADLLSLGKRLDWGRLCALVGICESAWTLEEFAFLARAKPSAFPAVYAAALLSGSADAAARYLERFGEEGLSDLREALALGQGAVALLLKRQVVINRGGPAADWDAAAGLVLRFPTLSLFLKYLVFFLGGFLVFHGLERLLFDPLAGDARDAPRMKNVVLGLLTGFMLAVGTEPALVNVAKTTGLKIELAVPVISNLGTPGATLSTVKPTTVMDTNTLLSIGIFLTLQIGMYLVCLWKMRSIERRD
ncbi:MAG: hypothetical protein LBR12_05065, partial [Opitutaceae bacterium]|nr:hypothetical protein [Opitutaceae bacterium]